MEYMFCKKCGAENKDGAAFCNECGTVLVPTPVQSPTVSTPQILYSTQPKPISFIFRYLMALSPIFLVIVCIFVRDMVENFFHVFYPSLYYVPAMEKVPFAAVGYVNQYSSMIADTISIVILIIAPVSIFIIFAFIGWWFKITELWTSTTLTLGLSLIGGVLLETGLIVPHISGNYLLVFLQWIAFLVQPICILSSVLVLLYTVKFRRSIQYTITKEGVVIQWGVFRQREKTIPHNHIGKVIFEQDFIGSRYNYGTVILQNITPERKIDNLNFCHIGSLRNPLNCLFGVPNPKTPQQILNFVIEKSDDI